MQNGIDQTFLDQRCDIQYFCTTRRSRDYKKLSCVMCGG